MAAVLSSSLSPPPPNPHYSPAFLFEPLSAEGISSATATVYWSAIANPHTENGLQSPDTKDVRLALKTFKRLCPSQNDQRLPVDIHVMNRLKANLRGSTSYDQDKLVLWCAYTSAFCGLLRVSEFCSTSGDDPSNRTSPRKMVKPFAHAIHLQLCVTKTDQAGSGATVIHTETGRSICPMRACWNYIQRQICSPAAPKLPFFVVSSGRFLARSTFAKITKVPHRYP